MKGPINVCQYNKHSIWCSKCGLTGAIPCNPQLRKELK